MTIQGALSDDAFTFILGTLFGAILTFLQNMLSPGQSDETA
jgi:ABC-type enterochelin transport system permease subunit